MKREDDRIVPESPPDRLFKYRPFDEPDGERLRQIIVGHHLWAASPSDFNDPYDCFPVIDQSGSAHEKRVFVERMAKRGLEGLSRNERRLRQAELRSAIYAVLNGEESLASQTIAWRDTVARMGVISFADDATSMVLWAHYAGNHSGVCLAFDTATFPINLASKVIYDEARPVFRFLNRDRRGVMEANLLRKAPEWSYEREWRLFRTGEVGAAQISVTALKAVILGARISRTHEDEVRRMVAARPFPVPIQRAALDNTDYRMTILNE